jgi:hypothetical protein
MALPQTSSMRYATTISSSGGVDVQASTDRQGDAIPISGWIKRKKILVLPEVSWNWGTALGRDHRSISQGT